MPWVRTGEPPETIKVSFSVTAKDHPELARFIWRLPYRTASRTLRDVLAAAVKDAEGAQPAPAASAFAEAPTAERIGRVSTSAADAIRRFDKMFPGEEK